MTDEELIDLYLDNLRFADRADTTLDVRRYYLKKAAREVGFTGEDDDPAKAILGLRQRYQAWLLRPSIQAVNTRKLWISTLHGFFQWGNANGYFQRFTDAYGALTDFDPTIGMPKIKGTKGMPHPVAEDDLLRVIELAEPKMKCWLLLGAASGLRCKEIALLAVENIDEANELLHLTRTKGEKQRDAPLTSEVIEALRAYGMPEAGRLWPDTPSQVSRNGCDFLHRNGITLTMHALRHRFGTQFYRATNDAFLTANYMGHSSTEITRVYAAPDPEKAQLARDALRVTRS